jgi:hypothetical protein
MDDDARLDPEVQRYLDEALDALEEDDLKAASRALASAREAALRSSSSRASRASSR